MPGHVPQAVPGLKPIAHFAETNQLHLAIGLPLRNAAALTNFLRDLYDPASPNFRHFLTPAQFTERFGPTVEDYEAVAAFARAHHLAVTTRHPNRLLLDVSGSVEDIEQTFHVSIQVYQHPDGTRTFHAPDADPWIALSVPIRHVSGFDDYSLAVPNIQQVTPLTGDSNEFVPNAGSGISGTFMGLDFRSAYAPDTTLTGAGQVVGLLQFDGYNPNDIADYVLNAGLAPVPLENVLIDGFNGAPSGRGGDVEVSLDIEMVISMAPGLSKVIVYEAPNPSPFEDVLSQMANDNLAKQLSCSWFIPNGDADPNCDPIFAQMQAQGQSFMTASGDFNAWTGLIPFPCDRPDITVVGGTTLTTSTDGGYLSETVWNHDGHGTGGGVSTHYPIPSYQVGIDMTANNGSTTMRNTPDVALTADNIYVRAERRNFRVVGTSAAAPLWAGFMALANEQAMVGNRSPIGFINPLVRTIGDSANYGVCFHDITVGDNVGFDAVTGYDLCTGWGTPTGQKLVDAFAAPEELNVSPADGFASVGGVGGPFTVMSQNYSLANNGIVALNWSAAGSAPWLQVAAASGTLNPGGAATAITISLTAAANGLAIGNYHATVQITDLASGIAQTIPVDLQVVAANDPPVIITQPKDVQAYRGSTVQFEVTVNGTAPFSYQWKHNGTSISGATAAALTLSGVQVADAGTYTVDINNTVGSVTSSGATLDVTVVPIPDNPQPANLAVGVPSTTGLSWYNGGSIQLINNGTFESGTLAGWTQVRTGSGLFVVNNGTYQPAGPAGPPGPDSPLPPHTGAFSALADGKGFGEFYLYQDITVPSSAQAATLSWAHRIRNFAPDFSAHQGFRVEICTLDNEVLATAFSTQPGDTLFDDWVQKSYDLLPFAGQKIRVRFLVNPGVYFLDVHLDDVSVQVDGFTGAVNNDVYFGTNPNPGPAEYVGSTSGSSWTLPLLEPQTTYYWRIVANSGGTATGPVWQFTTAGLDHFVWDPITSPQSVNGAFAGRLVAKDKFNQTVTRFNGPVSIRAASAATPVGMLEDFENGWPHAPWYPVNGSEFNNPGTLDPAGAHEGNFGIGNVDWTFRTDVLVGRPGDVLSCWIRTPSVPTGVIALGFGVPPAPWVGANPERTWMVQVSTAGHALSIIKGTEYFGSYGYVGPEAETTFNWLPSKWYKLAIEFPAATSVNCKVYDSDGTTFLTSVSYDNITGLPAGVAFQCEGPLNQSLDSAIDSVNVSVMNDYLPIITSGNFSDGVWTGNIIVSQHVANIALYADDGNYHVGKSNPFDVIYNSHPPFIVTQPASQTAVVGDTPTFVVKADGSDPLTYQWKFNGVDIPGATGASFTVNGASSANAGAYTVLVGNGYGSVLSASATLTVNPLPACDSAPSGIVAWWRAEGNANDTIGAHQGVLQGNVTYGAGKVGQAFVFDGTYSVVQLGSVPDLRLADPQFVPFYLAPLNLTIEGWIKRSSADQISKTSDKAEIFSWNYGGYRFGIKNDGNLMFSQVVSYEDGNDVSTTTSITDLNWHHVAVTLTGGNTVTFYVDGKVFPAPYVSFGGNVNWSLGVAAIGARPDNMANVFYGSIDDLSIYNRALSTAEIQAIYAARQFGKGAEPVIASQPANQTVFVGSTVTFSVSACGFAPLSYQWQFNGADLPGQTASTLTLANVQLNRAGQYRVRISNALGTVYSTIAILSVVIPPPTVAIQSVTPDSFAFTLNGLPRSFWNVYESVDLAHWTPIGALNLDPASGNGLFTDGDIPAGVTTRFYRVSDGIVCSRVIGFTRIDAASGWNPIANPFDVSPTDDPADNTLAAVFAHTVLPIDSVFHKENVDYTWDGSDWSADTTLSPGEGAFIQNDTGNPLPIIFAGYVREGHLVNSIATTIPDYDVQSSMVPQAGGLVSTLGYVPQSGDLIYRWNNSTHTWGAMVMYFDADDAYDQTGVYTVAGWYDANFEPTAEPVIGIAEVFVLRPNGYFGTGNNDWVRDFTVPCASSCAPAFVSPTPTGLQPDSFQFLVTGPVGSVWSVYKADTLGDWSLAGTVTLDANTGTSLFEDTITGVPARFYKVSNGQCCSRVIGFTRVAADSGYTAIANQLDVSADDDPTRNTLTAIFSHVTLPAGTKFVKQSTFYTWDGSAWSGAATLSPGEGGFVQNNSGSPFTVAFAGYVREGQSTFTLPIGNSERISSVLPRAGGITSALNYQPTSRDMFLRWDTQHQTWVGYISYYDADDALIYTDGTEAGWYDAVGEPTPEPTVSIGEAFYLGPPGPTETWIQTFSGCH